MAKKDVQVFAPPAPAAVKAFGQAISNFATDNPAGSYGGLPIMRLLKGDGWHFGADNIPAEDGSHWAINVLTMQHGWVCWTDRKNQKNEKIGEIMVDINVPRPEKTDLPEKVDPDTGDRCFWNECMSVEMRCITGGDKGAQVIYIAASSGGMDFFKKLSAKVATQYEEDPRKIIPVVTLEKSNYAHKVHGRVWKPEFEIVGWANWDEKEVTETAPKKAKPARKRKAA